jgi:hypothetical protein
MRVQADRLHPILCEISVLPTVIITALSSIVLCPLWLKVNRAHVFVVVPLVDLDETCAMHSCRIFSLHLILF